MPTDIVKQVLRAREGTHVQRCHCCPHFDSYTVGQHVADMFVLLDALHPDPSPQLMRAVLHHDLHERFLGDIPGCVTAEYPFFKATVKHVESMLRDELQSSGAMQLDLEDSQWLWAVDKIELLLWCEDQEAHGNRHSYRIKEHVLKLIHDRWPQIPVACQVFIDEFRWDRVKELSLDK